MKEKENAKISKQEKLNYVLQKIKEDKITNYELEQNTGISQSGLGSLTSGKTQNPRPATVDALYNYIRKRSNDSTIIDKEIFNNIEIEEYEVQKKKFIKLSIEKKLDVIFDQNFKILKEYDNILGLIEAMSLSNEISIAPILRHFKLKKDKVPTQDKKGSSIN